MSVIYLIIAVTENYLIYGVCNSIDGASAGRRNRCRSGRCDECYVPLPKSTKFESFQMSSSFVNHIVKEISTSSTVIISFDSYYENSLKAQTKERWKGYHSSV